MPFRFQKRITILPGLRLNLSKSGVSLSAGPRGASITAGKRGVYGNVGIPGTGLSYRERLDKPKGQTSKRQKPQLPDKIAITLSGNAIEFCYSDNTPLPSELIPAAKKLAKEEARDLLQRHADERNEPIARLGQQHHDIGPTIRRFGNGQDGKPKRINYDSHEAYMTALMTWRADKANKGPDDQAIGKWVVETLSELRWLVDPDISVTVAGGRVSLDVEMPSFEAMPQMMWRPHYPTLSLTEKPLSAKEIAGIHLDYLCSSVVRLIGHTLAASSEIKSVAISTNILRNASTGRMEKEYVLTVEVPRAAWCEINLAAVREIDPHNLLRHLSANLAVDRRGNLLVQKPLS